MPSLDRAGDFAQASRIPLSDNASNPPPRGFVVAISVVMIGAAIQFFYLGVTRAPAFKGPPWVAYVIGLIFLAGGAQFLATAFGRAGRGLWLGFIFITGIAAVFWWISLAGDARDCAASFGPVSLPPRACQIGFGFGAALCTAYALYIARLLLFPRRQPRSYY